MITQKTMQVIRLRDARASDIKRIGDEIKAGKFNFEKRYNLEYLLTYSLDYDWEKSRLMRAVEEIALEHRMRSRPKPKPAPDVLTIKEAAYKLGRHPRTIENWLKQGLLRKIKIGGSVFVSRVEIDSLLSAHSDPIIVATPHINIT